MTLLRKATGPKIDESAPWYDDPFNREAEGEMLARLIASSTDAPLVVSLQSPWGSGKTVFLRRLALHIKTAKDIPTIRIDAWKTDDCSDPLVAIIAELSLHLEKFKKEEGHLASDVDSCISRLAKFGSKIMLPATSIVADLHTPGSGDVLRSAGAFAERLLDMQKDRSSAEKDFRDVLIEARCLMTGRGRNRKPAPMLLIIDELDRCRPDHAIRTLERIKHYFDVPGISFLIATDRGNLPAAVKSVYGAHVDGELYLRKFFDYEFHLAPPNPIVFAKNLASESILPDIDPIMPEKPYVQASNHLEFVVNAMRVSGRQMLKGEYLDAFPAFSQCFSLTLRDQEQAMTMISAYVHTRERENELLPVVDCFLACLRFGHPSSFKAIVDGTRTILLQTSKAEDDMALLQRVRVASHWDAISATLETRVVISLDDEPEKRTISSTLLKSYQNSLRSGKPNLALLMLAARLHRREFDIYTYASSFVRLSA
ncbi:MULTISPECIES: KAP family P-loop NTPase fold protein [Stenotrophomonas]|uniref:KAP family P-loop NTPase fold protein n=1 Tax=Stenotrophomonas TaxID=40323 RepID=UPI000A2FFA49|nr:MULTISPECIES: P-loop NTPase fold protein [Stenotrophomonas]ARQ90141.1 hypothetical protein A7326_11250 [Stenotrophomonas maltophilia]MBN5157814.1 hypothetical protein [Stenotrophomonas maltophilia]MDG9842138.1 KAP family NTPase [Stenotrophomonas sp. GD04054]MDH0016031.1 KAP family NTPase [Stenotrophomonas sp. GD04028]MDH0574659.1 KAP family NTPase [Stenotrophomonas sp. GD03997]